MTNEEFSIGDKVHVYNLGDTYIVGYNKMLIDPYICVALDSLDDYEHGRKFRACFCTEVTKIDDVVLRDFNKGVK